MLLLQGSDGKKRIVAAIQNTPDSAAKSGDPSAAVVYTFTIVNIGNAGDVFTITKIGEAWTTVISDSSHSLEPSANTTFDVTVTIPANAAGAATDGVTITATSANDPAVSDADSLTTTANTVVALTDVPDATAKTGNANTNVVYTFTLTNTGNATDTFTITKAGEVWTTVISDNSHILTAGANTTFDVTVTVPLTANDAATDAVTITATSGNDASVTDVDNLTTTAVAMPKVIGTPVMWIDASQITGLSNNDPVASWPDLSGNARHATQTTEANKPIYMTAQQNGLPGVDFDRASHGMLVDFTTSVSAQDYTFIFAAKTRTTGVNADQRLFDFETGRFIVSSVTATAGWVGWITLPEGWNNVVAATNAVQILSFVLDDAGASVYRDGAAIATGAAWAQKALGGTVGMGREYDMTQYGFDGQLYEVIIYTGALSTANRELVEGYLSAKWDIALA